MSDPRRVVVIGALGFLGRGVRAGLAARGHRVVGIARRSGEGVDATCALGNGDDGDALSRLLEPSDVVVNVAGLGTKDTSDAVALAAGNLAIARDVGLACARRGARLVHVSSADVHPIATRAGALETAHVVPDSAYGLAKLFGELQFASLLATSGLAYVVLRPTYVVGSGLPSQRLFPAILAQLAADPPLTVVTLHGDPDARIDYLAMNDLVGAVDVIAQRASFTGERYQAASGTLTSTRDAAAMMVRAAGRNVPVVFSETSTVCGARQTGPVSTQALTELGWSAKTSLLDALRVVAEVK